jgi:hypothetical protein
MAAAHLWLCGLPKRLACRSPAEGAALATSTGKHMSTTALDVDSRERASASEQDVIDVARDPHLRQEKPTATSTSTLAAPAAEQLDLATALKVSEEISGEIVQESSSTGSCVQPSSTRAPSEGC